MVANLLGAGGWTKTQRRAAIFVSGMTGHLILLASLHGQKNIFLGHPTVGYCGVPMVRHIKAWPSKCGAGRLVLLEHRMGRVKCRLSAVLAGVLLWAGRLVVILGSVHQTSGM